jgi:hypothetical protein
MEEDPGWGRGGARALHIKKFTANFKDVFEVSKFHGKFQIVFTNKRGGGAPRAPPVLHFFPS